MKQLFTRMQPEDVIVLEELAHEAGLTVAAYIRMVLMREVRRRQERTQWSTGPPLDPLDHLWNKDDIRRFGFDPRNQASPNH